MYLRGELAEGAADGQHTMHEFEMHVSTMS